MRVHTYVIATDERRAPEVNSFSLLIPQEAPAGIYFVVADLRPDTNRADGLYVIRHSGLKVVKMNK